MKYNTKTPLQRKIEAIQKQRQQKIVLKDNDFILDEWEDIEERGY